MKIRGAVVERTKKLVAKLTTPKMARRVELYASSSSKEINFFLYYKYINIYIYSRNGGEKKLYFPTLLFSREEDNNGDSARIKPPCVQAYAVCFYMNI